MSRKNQIKYALLAKRAASDVIRNYFGSAKLGRAISLCSIPRAFAFGSTAEAAVDNVCSSQVSITSGASILNRMSFYEVLQQIISKSDVCFLKDGF